MEDLQKPAPATPVAGVDGDASADSAAVSFEDLSKEDQEQIVHAVQEAIEDKQFDERARLAWFRARVNGFVALTEFLSRFTHPTHATRSNTRPAADDYAAPLVVESRNEALVSCFRAVSEGAQYLVEGGPE